MDAIVAAGGIPNPGEPLYEYTQGKSKALLDVCGKPMIQWVLDALSRADTIEQVLIVGLPADSQGSASHLAANSQVRCDKLVEFIPDQGGLLQNLRAGMIRAQAINPSARHTLTVSSDIPAINAEMVDWVVNKALETDDDAYYNVITRQVMEARYPNSRRSYLRLKDVEVCGGDMNVIRTTIGTERDALWERIIASRKNALKQASLIGFDTMLLVLFHIITLDQAVRLASRRLKLHGRAVLCPFAEIGMDVDKPFQLEIVRADMARQVPA